MNRYPALLIGRMATATEHQRRGIGENMMKLIFAFARNQCQKTGCSHIFVDAKNDERTIRFYERKCGFRRIGQGNEETVPFVKDVRLLCGMDGQNVQITKFL
jgi:predicted N-acetyltransferase YhbS